MVKLNRAQRKALKRIYDRGPIWISDLDKDYTTGNQYNAHADHINHLSYREFRRRVKPGYDCVLIHWCGMWLGIESDGYTHS